VADETTDFGTLYCKLGLRIDKHLPGYVDAYFGPKRLKADVDEERRKPVSELMEDAEKLRRQIPTGDKVRETFLQKQLESILTTLRRLNGEEIPYREEVLRLFDVRIEKISEAKVEKSRERLSDIFGTSDLRMKLGRWRRERYVQRELIKPTLSALARELAGRSRRLLGTKKLGTCVFSLVKNKPWSGYNWYLGRLRSRVEINVDKPIEITDLPKLVAHEAYPGHHTEHALKEEALYRGKGYLESSIFLINAPEATISEGIAENGLEFVFECEEDALRWTYSRFAPKFDASRDASIVKALEELREGRVNAAIMLHVENRSERDVLAYLTDVLLENRVLAKRTLKFLKNPLFRSYIFCYTAGREMIAEVLKQKTPNDRQRVIQKLYTAQICPSNLKVATSTLSSSMP